MPPTDFHPFYLDFRELLLVRMPKQLIFLFPPAISVLCENFINPDITNSKLELEARLQGIILALVLAELRHRPEGQLQAVHLVVRVPALYGCPTQQNICMADMRVSTADVKVKLCTQP